MLLALLSSFYDLVARSSAFAAPTLAFGKANNFASTWSKLFYKRPQSDDDLMTTISGKILSTDRYDGGVQTASPWPRQLGEAKEDAGR